MTERTTLQHPAISAYLKDVRKALRRANEPDQIAEDILASLREQIDAMATEGLRPEEIRHEMAAPESFAASQPGTSPSKTPRYGLVGIVLGVGALLLGQLISLIAPPSVAQSIGDPMIVVGAVLAMSLGTASIRSPWGIASLLFGAAIILIILAAMILD